jgi:hypothetical protein
MLFRLLFLVLLMSAAMSSARAENAADQKAAQACAAHMPQLWLQVGDDWYTRIVSSHLHLDYFVEARTLKPNIVKISFGEESHEGRDERRFVGFYGSFRTTETGGWSAWKELKKGDLDDVYRCIVDHQENDNAWHVVGAGVLKWKDLIVVKPNETDLPK